MPARTLIKKVTILILFVLVSTLSSCGGGGGGTTTSSTPAPAAAASLAAVFSDAPVVGLPYNAMPSGTSGITNSLGQFKYAPGDTVTFSFAGVTLGVASNLPTTSTSGNPSVITPINLVSGATNASNSTVTAIGQFLAGLNSVAVAVGQGTGGLFTIPSTTGLTGANLTTVATLVGTLQASSTTAANLPAAVLAGGAVQTAIATAGGTVPTPTNAQANITQGLNSAGIVGSMWTAPCAACTGSSPITLFFNSDGVVWGYGAISSASSGSLIGTWQTSASSGGASFTVVSSPGPSATGLDGTYMSGTVSGTTGSAQIFNASYTAQGSPLTLSIINIPPNTNTTYVGAWEVFIDTVTANTTGAIAGSSALFVFEPNGNWYKSTGGSAGTYNMTTGIVTSATGTNNIPPASCGQPPVVVSASSSGGLNLATGAFSDASSTGHVVRAGLGAEVLTRFYDNANTLAEASQETEIPLSLNVSISWPANIGTATSSLDLGVVMTGPNTVGTSCSITPATKLESFGVRPELNPLGSGALAASTTDTFSVGYIKGQSTNYQVSILGPSAQYCSVTSNGSGTVVDTNSGNSLAYPTVTVVCTQ